MAVAEISRLAHTDASVAGAIWSLCQDAYAIEAELLGVDDFPPLRRTRADIQSSQTEFHGITVDGNLIALAELARLPECCVDSLVVAPAHFRRGLASRLLEHVVHMTAPDRLLVDTGAANGPALTLYRRHGFVESERRVSGEGIELVRLVLNRRVPDA